MSFQASTSRSFQAVVSSAFVLFIVSFAIGSLSFVSLILTWFSLLFLLLCFPYAARGTAAYPNPAAIQGDDGGWRTCQRGWLPPIFPPSAKTTWTAEEYCNSKCHWQAIFHHFPTCITTPTDYNTWLKFSCSFLKNILCGIAPHSNIINVLQVLGSAALFQYSLDQPMAIGWAVFPPLGQTVPGILNNPPGEGKLWPAFCGQRNGKEGSSNVSGGIALGCFWLQFLLEF